MTKLKRINFEVTAGFRKQFKTKVTRTGKTIKEVLMKYMSIYLKKG